MDCRDAGRVDLRSDAAGVPNVMEINPLAGIHPEHSDLPIICSIYGIPYTDLMRMIMDSALSRKNEGQHKMQPEYDPAAAPNVVKSG